MNKNKQYNELYYFLKRKTFTYIKNKVNDEDTAEEYFQTSFIKLYLKYGLNLEYKDYYNIIMRIIKNQITDSFRRKKVSKTDLFESFDFIQTDNEEYDYEIENKVELIKKLSNNLPNKYKTVFDMFAFRGYIHEEISLELNINKGTSRSNFFKAKNKIKEQFELEYFKK
jgi:RNA polymerase sigma factor (sigma-70 family)